MIPFMFRCCGGGRCPSDIVLRCHAMVTTVELQRCCIHCSHSEAVNHRSVFRRSLRLLNLPGWMTGGNRGLVWDSYCKFPSHIPHLEVRAIKHEVSVYLWFNLQLWILTQVLSKVPSWILYQIKSWAIWDAENFRVILWQKSDPQISANSTL